MTREQLDEFEAVLAAVRTHGTDNEYVKEIDPLLDPLVKALREAREALDEREGDMHARIRAGYDKTVADMWRAHCAKIEKERDEARAEVARMKARPAETEYSRLDGMWQQLVRERDESRAEVERLKALLEKKP